VFLTTAIGAYFFQEYLTPTKVISAAMIVGGVMGLHFSHPPHS
jgi:multidrug transporter EmrE-like cation transporter